MQTYNRAPPVKVPNEWYRFIMYGEWQKEMPTRPGTYPIADRMGNPAGTNTVVLYKGKPQAVTAWEGWWWSVSQPYLPRPPSWADNE